MKMVLFGAGLQAQAASYDLLQQDDVTEVVVADANLAAAQALADRWKDARVKPVAFDASSHEQAVQVMQGAKAALSAVPYVFNAGLAKAAVEAGCSFCDLGGNNDVVNAELALHDAAAAAGVTIVPDCGLAPGMVAVLTAHAVEAFDEVESAEIRVAGLPQERGGILDYSLLFSIEGLINEYVEPVVNLVDGEPVTVPPLDDFETLTFPEPFGELEAFNTSGGTSTLPETYRGKIKTLNYKTMRYPGHGRVFRAMMDLGLLSSEPIQVGDVKIAPRKVFSAAATPVLDRGLKDVALVRVTVRGTREGKPATRVYQAIEYPDEAVGLTAMMRTTAFPATIVQLMLARGEIEQKGALTQERCVNPSRFLEELKARKIDVQITDS